MEMKITFRFDCSEGFLACIDKLREAALAIAQNGGFESLPDKGKGTVKGVATEEGVVIKKKEVVYPPVEDDAPDVVDDTPEAPAGKPALTLADAKKAMDAARVRIEGKDYQDSTAEGHKKYHRELTATMKKLMTKANPDAMKPADLDESQLEWFISAVNSLNLEDGKITQTLPF